MKIWCWLFGHNFRQGAVFTEWYDKVFCTRCGKIAPLAEFIGDKEK